MIAVLEKACPLKQKAKIVSFVESAGFRVQVSEHNDQSMIGVIGPGAEKLAEALAAMPGVHEIRPVALPYPLVSREQHPESTRVKVEGVTVGGTELVVIAGPCAVESHEQILTVAKSVAAAGASMLRGGAFKPRSSPYSFQGMGKEGLELLAEARHATGLKVVTEVVALEDIDLVAQYADVLHVHLAGFSMGLLHVTESTHTVGSGCTELQSGSASCRICDHPSRQAAAALGAG